MTFYDNLDEIEYFLSDNERHLGEDNLRRIKTVLGFEFVLCLVFTGVNYILSDDFELHPACILFLVVDALLWKLTATLVKKERTSLRLVRCYAFFCYTLLFLLVAVIEFAARDGKEAVLFPAAMIATVAFYVDRMQYVVCYNILLSILYLVADGRLQSKSVLLGDLISVPAACVTAIFCYYMILCIQTDTGRGNRELRHKSNTDMLTGLYNKIAFEDAVKNFILHREPGTCCTLFIFDFDNFKRVNDNFGHQTGDEVLKYFGYLLHKSFRANDFVGRVGGDEFMVLMAGTVPGGYAEQRCRDILHELRGKTIGKANGFSASIGIAQDDGTADFNRLYKVADSALYQAKENGKDCYVKYYTYETADGEMDTGR